MTEIESLFSLEAWNCFDYVKKASRVLGLPSPTFTLHELASEATPTLPLVEVDTPERGRYIIFSDEKIVHIGLFLDATHYTHFSRGEVRIERFDRERFEKGHAEGKCRIMRRM